MIGLDGLELSVAAPLFAAGELPALAAIRERAARFELEHGLARHTGLAWEHVSSGLSPEAANRFTAVEFDRATYDAYQSSTRLPPFPATLGRRTLVFDAPYFDLANAPGTLGMVNWGAHDPGVPPTCRPENLAAEVQARFGRYPAPEYLYGLAWHSAAQAERLGAGLAAAAARRTAIARWLLAERLPDWDLALVVAGEPHSAIEALWHGVDPAHPAHALPSQAAAAAGLARVYRAMDRMVAELAAACPEATLLLFNLHGMGTNDGDLPSMVLLPELLYRDRFGHAALAVPPDWQAAPGGLPALPESESWSRLLRRQFTARRRPARRVARALGRLAGRRELPLGNLDWMPARWYQPWWRRMRAFALPAFYDGRIRVNLAGREAAGRVALADYGAELDRLERLIGGTRDLFSGQPAVARFERPAERDPLALVPSGADLVVRWAEVSRGFEHPRLGRIGPVPLRRTGGHTGGHGFAWFAGAGIAAGERGLVSSFDVVPTAIDLVQGRRPAKLSGESRIKALLQTALL
jgi:predicted AlkP superfamily phosphohydrolase/phosphomutase